MKARMSSFLDDFPPRANFYYVVPEKINLSPTEGYWFAATPPPPHPHPSGNSNLAPYFSLKTFAFAKPLPLGISIDLGYFLELHTVVFMCASSKDDLKIIFCWIKSLLIKVFFFSLGLNSILMLKTRMRSSCKMKKFLSKIMLTLSLPAVIGLCYLWAVSIA